MGGKLITIAMPTYNLGEYVRNAIEDMAVSRYFDCLDILIVDDGSTDKTPEICSRLSDEYRGVVRYIRKDNGHYGSAVNVAIDAAEGKYFKIIDADDRVNPDGMNAFIDFVAKNDSADLIINDFVVEYDEGTADMVSFEFPSGTLLDMDSVSIKSLPMHAAAYKTSILKANSIRLDEGVPYTDVEFVLYPMPFVHKIAYLPEVFYRYQIGREGQSISSAQMVSNRRKHQFVLESLIDWREKSEKMLLENGSYEFATQRISEMFEKQVQVGLESKSNNEEVQELRALKSKMGKSRQLLDSARYRFPFRMLIALDFKGFSLFSMAYLLARRVMS